MRGPNQLNNSHHKKKPPGWVAFFKMVGRAGFEPATNWLKANCSTDGANDPKSGARGRVSYGLHAKNQALKITGWRAQCA